MSQPGLTSPAAQLRWEQIGISSLVYISCETRQNQPYQLNLVDTKVLQLYILLQQNDDPQHHVWPGSLTCSKSIWVKTMRRSAHMWVQAKADGTDRLPNSSLFQLIQLVCLLYEAESQVRPVKLTGSDGSTYETSRCSDSKVVNARNLLSSRMFQLQHYCTWFWLKPRLKTPTARFDRAEWPNDMTVDVKRCPGWNVMWI